MKLAEKFNPKQELVPSKYKGKSYFVLEKRS